MKHLKTLKQLNESENVRSSSYIKENPNGYIIKLDSSYYLITNEKILKGDMIFFPKQNSLRLCESDMESDGINSVRPDWVLKAVKFNFFNLD